MTKIITSVGLMSGTSLDGIDASIIQSDGEDHLEIIGNNYTEYSSSLREEIRELKKKINNSQDIKNLKNEIEKIEKKITILHADSVNKILGKFKIKNNNINIVGFHGQTIFHSYKDKITKQIGDAKLLNKLLNIDIIYNFRENDLKNGGQGAPLTPIYHKILRKKIKLPLPVAFINIGGISNISYLNEDEKLKSFDCGPGNCLIDSLIQLKSNDKIQYDKSGLIASKGIVNKIILENYLNNPYYELFPPKTLDTGDFSLSIIRGISLENSISTLSELTARTIVDSLNFFKNKPKKLILIGGGRKNKFIFDRIKDLSSIQTVDIDNFDFNGDFIESQAFAYLAIRSLLSKPITYKETTGVSKASTGGRLISIK